ncbi:MAG: lipoyl synthase [Deltaproteobacteria bacterium]|nr:lipoyl synthase [Deltaproteobacteria bacterium]
MPHTLDAPLRLPPALRKRLGRAHHVDPVRATLRAQGLSTVCEEARCPNLGECFTASTATFMILGDRCTRRCRFCNVRTAKPGPPDADEPARLADAAAHLGLRHVVITSVDRDDLADRGAGQFAACIAAVRARLPHATVEVLTPDFGGDARLVDVVLAAGPDVFNHNLETVARLYRDLRPQSSWRHTNDVLGHASRVGHPAVKSGIMVGLGETDDEVLATLSLMRELGVHIATIGQYLRPTRAHWPVARYVEDESYARFTAHGRALGLTHVAAAPFVRSSYHAHDAHLAHRASTMASGALAASSPSLRVLP